MSSPNLKEVEKQISTWKLSRESPSAAAPEDLKIYFNPHMKILVAISPVDLRKGFDSLAGYCRDYLGEDPHSGVIFAFCNRSRTHLRLFFYDSQGLWVATKRLSQGRFPWWPNSSEASSKLRTLDRRIHKVLCPGTTKKTSRL